MPDPLDEILRQAQDLGLLGPAPVGEQRHHAEAFCRLALAGIEPATFLDLGSGGGLPGLVLARDSALPGTLLDSQRRRTEFLEQVVARLEATDRIQILTARAEDAARDEAHRERYDLVVARSFGPPAVTAECAVGFLAPAARLAVSEPPDTDPDRWNAHQLATLGLTPPEIVRQDNATVALFHRAGPLDPKWPRRPGIPKKRPLW